VYPYWFFRKISRLLLLAEELNAAEASPRSTFDHRLDGFHIVLGFFVWGNSFVFIDGAGAGVVSGQCFVDVVVVAIEEGTQEACTSIDRRLRISGIHLVGACSRGHELHEAFGAGLATDGGVESAFLFGNRGEQYRRHVVLLSGFYEQCVVFAVKFRRNLGGARRGFYFPELAATAAALSCGLEIFSIALP
jgi:hypothetical protein